VTVRRPDGSTAPARIEDGRFVFPATDEPGRYTVEGPGVRWTFAANLLDAEESDVARPGGSATDPAPAAIAGETAPQDVARPLLAVALPLLSLEMWLLGRRARGRR
jgi:hypothetical protein